METPKAIKLPRALDSVLRVETEQDVHQAEKATERIRLQESDARTNERNSVRYKM